MTGSNQQLGRSLVEGKLVVPGIICAIHADGTVHVVLGWNGQCCDLAACRLVAGAKQIDHVVVAHLHHMGRVSRLCSQFGC